MGWATVRFRIRLVFLLATAVSVGTVGYLCAEVTLHIVPELPSKSLVNHEFRATLRIVGGMPEYGWRVIEKPDWLTVTPRGTSCSLAGTPSLAGTYQLCVGVGDGRGQAAQACFDIYIDYVILGVGVFIDDFEGGQPNGWSTEDLWHLAYNTACVSPPYASATHAYYYGRDATCNYVTSPPNNGAGSGLVT